MKVTSKQSAAMQNLVNLGINFEKDVFCLSSDEKNILLAEAKRFKYRPKANASCLSSIRSSRFFLYMQRVYNSVNAK